jgi:predicted transposase YbfD/YdcC
MDVHALGGMLRHLDTIDDPRRHNVTYTLPQLLCCTLMAVLCRCDDYEEIAGWVALRHAWLVEVLGLPEDRTPCRKTFERVFRRLEPEALGRCFVTLTQRLAEASQGRLIAIDGKTLRGSFDRAHRDLPIHLVHAWDRDNGLVLGQVAVDEKSNEITAVPALLELLDVRGAVLSLDAMHCQTQTAQLIRQADADYLLAAKKNQKSLHEDIKLFFDDAIAPEGRGDPHLLTHTMEPDNGHGRLDERAVWASGEVGWLRRRHPDWQDLRGVVCVQSKRTDFATGKASQERRFYLTSLSPGEVGVARLADLVRGHWSVENQLHWSLDVSFGDDRCRVRKDHGPANLAAIKRLTLGLVKRSLPPASTTLKARRTSLKMRRLRCGMDDAYLIQTLMGGREDGWG